MPTVTANIPVIETERLILREPRESDVPAVAAFNASERSVFIGGGPEVVAKDGPHGAEFFGWRIITSSLGHWALRGYGFWTVEDRASGQPAGRVGFINHVTWPEPELGWQVFDGFEGKGVAYEAALAARNAGSRLFGLNGVISLIAPTNTRSLRLAERLGAVIESETELFGKPALVHRHPVEVAL